MTDDAREEILLVANIMDRLLDANATLRHDQLAPLARRLHNAADALKAAGQPVAKATAAPLLPKFAHSVDSAPLASRTLGVKNTKKGFVAAPGAAAGARKKVSTKQQRESSSLAEREAPQLAVSGEVSRSLCCTLYNVLECTVRLLRASHGHIFVKNDDDMVSIANVSSKLVFPPQQVHVRCMGSADAEVLGSCMALNRFNDDVGKRSAMLIYPIFGRETGSSVLRDPIATIHVERKDHVFERFNNSDECLLYYASVFCGELMARVPQFDWLSAFYDPVAQHVVAPFVPYRPALLPAIREVSKSVTADGDSMEAAATNSAAILSQLSQKMEAHSVEVLIRRETLPASNTRPFAPGVTHTPSLLEVQAYVDNLQSCWRKNMTENVDLLETERSTQQDLKMTRSELIATKRQLAAANEKLRLYELESKDYKFEYGALKTELNTYMDKLDRLY